MWQATAEEWHFEEAEEALRSTPKELGAEDTLLDELIDALNDGELHDQHKEALVAAIAGGADMLLWQIDRFTFNDDYAARLILCGDSDNLLVRASRRGRIESVRYLLSIGADVNGCNGFGDSALMAAAINGKVGVVRALMGAGADAYAEHPEIGKGFTPLVAAVDRCASGYPSCVVQQAQLAVVRCLLEEFKVNLKPPGLYGAASRPLISTVFSRSG